MRGLSSILSLFLNDLNKLINTRARMLDTIYHMTEFSFLSKNMYATMLWMSFHKVRKRAKIRNRYNQAPHLTQDTNGKVTTSQLDITSESQEVSRFPAGDHKASINRRARKHNKYKSKIT